MDVVYGSSGKPEPKQHTIDAYVTRDDAAVSARGRASEANIDPVFGSSGQPEPKSALREIIEAGMEVAVAARDKAREISDSPGAAPLHAFARQGADEIAQALVAFPAQGIQPVSEMGQLFEPTPAEADRQLTGNSLADIIAAGKEVEAAREQQRERDGMER